MLAVLGMAGFAERAAGAGRHRRDGAQHSAETVTTLTAQEALIARLARDGRTNPEIGAHLFLSGRTVEWHLRKIVSKLGISCLHKLHAALKQAAQGLRRLRRMAPRSGPAPVLCLLGTTRDAVGYLVSGSSAEE